MTNEQAIFILRNMAFLSGKENAEKTEEAIGMAIEALKFQQDSEQFWNEQFQDEGSCLESPYNSDLISRQDAIEAIEEVHWYHQNRKGEMVSGANSNEEQAWYKSQDVYGAIEGVPPAKPDMSEYSDKLWRSAYERGEIEAQVGIIRCKACKHWTQTTGEMQGFGLGNCDFMNVKFVNCNSYCYWGAERKDNG